MFTDIHSHIIYNVDDGSKSLSQSLKALDQIKKSGIEKVICTPHSKTGNIDKIMKIKENYLILKHAAEKRGIELYLGNEIMYSANTIKLLQRNRLSTLSDSKYILIEFKRNENMNIDNVVEILESIRENGYKPILAHPEFYIHYRNISDIYKIKETGTLLQMDATSILQTNNSKVYKFSKKLLKEKLIDIVATDSHCTKKRNYLSFKKAYKKIKRKYGLEYAIILFKRNPEKVVGGV